MNRDALSQIRRLLDPLRARLQNLVARAVVQVVDDAAKLQRIQVGAAAGEDIDDGEHFQPYGFSSVPPAGAEAVALFPNGDRSHPLVIVASDRATRPTGQDSGEVSIYHPDGARIHLLANGDVQIDCASGGRVLVSDGSGGSEPLITKSQYDAHTHPTGVGPSGVPSNIATSGTAVLEGK